MSTKIKNVYTADFETNNSDNAIESKKTFVWLWDVCNIKTLKHINGMSIETFFEYLNDFNEDSIIYFHNLKFDGSFMLSYLLKYCTWVNVEKIQDLDFCQFTTLIDARKIYYQIAFRNANGFLVIIRDSAKKIPGSVESIAESWKLPILKGKIDYKEDHIGKTVTKQELDYIHNDTEIIARVMSELYKEGMVSMTSSSDSFRAYKKCLKDNYNIEFEDLYPIVDIETDDFIRKAYSGGVCMYNPKYVDKMLENVVCYDVNSMYPSRMYYMPLPYGKPTYYEGKPPKDKLYVCHIYVNMKVKQDKFPSIMKKGFGVVTKNTYIEDSDNELIELYLTNVDVELMYKHYDIYEIQYIDGYWFKSSTELFKKYIGDLYKIKSTTSGVKKLLAKLKLNSLYGKFATNPYRHIVQPLLKEDGSLGYKIVGDIVDDPIYTGTSVFTTAYSRYYLYAAIEENHDNFIYCDTDSIHILGNEVKGIEIDKNKLGAWDREKEYESFKVLAQKTYMGILKGGKKMVKVCGAPANVKERINFENFKMGTSYEGKLAPKQVNGGTVLVDTTFTLKPR